jgi:hypothetical protein
MKSCNEIGSAAVFATQPITTPQKSESEQRKHQYASQDARRGQKVVRVYGGGLHGIDLLTDLHRAQFGADACGCAATDDQGCNDGAAFLDDRENDDGGQKRFCTEADRTVARGEGKDDASGSCGDGYRSSDFEPSSSN